MKKLLTLCLLFACITTVAQKLEPKKNISQPELILSSKIMGKDYQLYISFPANYKTTDTARYPVLYVLDGANSFPILKSAREAMDLDEELENVIIVGIGCGTDLNSWLINRHHDYTISSDTARDRSLEKGLNLPKGSLNSGGADKFLDCFSKEIIPLIDRSYNTSADRGLSGHSFGGLFTGYCLLTRPELFNRYGINSPSLWWKKKEMFSVEEKYFAQHKSLPAKAFISIGSKEGNFMVTPMTDFSKIIQTRNYTGLNMVSHIFEDETHLSVIPAMLSRTLKVLYEKK